jgi:hypothetical protein
MKVKEADSALESVEEEAREAWLAPEDGVLFELWLPDAA